MEDDWGTVPLIAADKVRLRDVLKPRKTIIDYTYDFSSLMVMIRLPARERFLSRSALLR